MIKVPCLPLTHDADWPCLPLTYDAGWLTWHTTGQVEISKLELLAQTRTITSKDIDNDLYKEYKQSIFDRFGGRCAYCESKIQRVDQHGDVEHFRPKLAVVGIDGKPVQIARKDGSTGKHPGYYWLVYAWPNLLPACGLCNRPSRIDENRTVGKWDYFPTEDGFYATSPEELSREKPLFLDPSVDNPADHLELETPSCVLLPKLLSDGQPSRRGSYTIDQLDLNRDGLVQQRKDAYRHFLKVLEDVLSGLKRNLASPAIDPDDLDEYRRYRKDQLAYMLTLRTAEREFREKQRRAIERMEKMFDPEETTRTTPTDPAAPGSGPGTGNGRS